MDQINILYKHDYPINLKQIKNLPNKFYIRGRLLADEKRKYLCVIGARRFTQYGRDAVNKILEGLQGYPISIVSGLAIGIDGIAHETALRYGLHCVGFPGSTLEWNALHPNMNVNVAKDVVQKGGALLSEWPVGYETGNWAFPRRNQYMAALSDATLIIEAARGSGSLMTAKHAELCQRDVMAVPGSIFSTMSYGPHMLLGRGAIQVTCAEDVLEAFGFSYSKQDKLAAILSRMDDRMKKVVEVVARGETSIDEIIYETGIKIVEMNSILTRLELAKVITIDLEGVRLK